MEYAFIPKTQDSFARLAVKQEQSAVEANWPTYHFEERMFIISQSMARSVGYDIKSVGLTEDAIPTIFDKLDNVKAKRISRFMEKLNRKRVCMINKRRYRVLWGVFTSSRIRE